MEDGQFDAAEMMGQMNQVAALRAKPDEETDTLLVQANRRFVKIAQELGYL